jgi:hypothetical protein
MLRERKMPSSWVDSADLHSCARISRPRYRDATRESEDRPASETGGRHLSSHFRLRPRQQGEGGRDGSGSRLLREAIAQCEAGLGLRHVKLVPRSTVQEASRRGPSRSRGQEKRILGRDSVIALGGTGPCRSLRPSRSGDTVGRQRKLCQSLLVVRPRAFGRREQVRPCAERPRPQCESSVAWVFSLASTTRGDER